MKNSDLKHTNTDWMYLFLFHVLAWSIYGGVYLYDIWESNKPANYWQIAVFATLLGNGLSVVLHFVYLHIRTFGLMRKILLAVGACLIASVIWSVLKSLYVNDWYQLAQTDRPYFSLRSIYHHLNPLLIWSTFYFLYDFHQLSIEHKINSLKSEALARENQLQLLSSQLNPHFLFNALNSIGGMVLKHGDVRIYQTVSGLSNFLRYSLESKPWKKVQVKREIECIQQYLAIQKIRFNDRLSTQFDCDKGADNALIPHLILLPLAENAIKHSIGASAKHVSIACHIRFINSESLSIKISNSLELPLSDGNEQSGIGIPNVKERLSVYYGDSSTIDINSDGQHFTVILTIPLEY